MSEANERQSTLRAASSADVAGMPWAFTQSQPLTSRDFTREADRRGFVVKASTLRTLYRHGLLVPFVYLGARQVGPIPAPVEYEPMARGTWLTELRYARDRGRLS